MNTFTAFKNYGVLAAEKKIVWTAGSEHFRATCSDKVTVKIPEGWELFETSTGLMVEAPWGWIYELNEIMAGNENPLFIVLDKDGKEHRIKLEIVE